MIKSITLKTISFVLVYDTWYITMCSLTPHCHLVYRYIPTRVPNIQARGPIIKIDLLH